MDVFVDRLESAVTSVSVLDPSTSILRLNKEIYQATYDENGHKTGVENITAQEDMKFTANATGPILGSEIKTARFNQANNFMYELPNKSAGSYTIKKVATSYVDTIGELYDVQYWDNDNRTYLSDGVDDFRNLKERELERYAMYRSEIPEELLRCRLQKNT